MIKNIIKKIIGNIYYYNFKFTNKKESLTIFLFHEVTNKPSEFQKKHKIFHTVDEFEKIIKWIKNNYNIVSPNEIFDNQKSKALITFDDGYYGSFKNGIPILNSLNIPSIHFLNCRPIIKHQPNIVSTIDYLCTHSTEFKKFIIDRSNIRSCDFYQITPKIFKLFSENNKIITTDIQDYQGKIVTEEDLNNQQNNKLVFFGNHFYDHWNILHLSKYEIKNYYFKNKMYLEKYKNYIDIFSFTHGVPGINFNKDNLSQIISYKPKFVFFSGGGTMKYNNLVFDRTFTTYDEINNKIFFFRKFKIYYSDLVST